MKKQTRYIVFFAIVAILVGLFVWYKEAPGPYDALANCMKSKGVVFYGAFWCPHCEATKQDFGKSATLLPYVECSEPADAQGNYSQTPICIAQHIMGYPTWQFPSTITLPGTSADSTFACTATYDSSQPSDCEGAKPGSWDTTISGRQYLSPSQPTETNGTWTLPPLSRTSGVTPIPLLAQLSDCPAN